MNQDTGYQSPGQVASPGSQDWSGLPSQIGSGIQSVSGTVADWGTGFLDAISGNTQPGVGQGRTQSGSTGIDNYNMIGPSQAQPANPVQPSVDDLAQRTQWGIGQALLNQANLDAPQHMQNQITREGYANQVAYQLANQSAETRYLNQGYDISNRLNNLQKQSTAVDQAANLRQPGFLTNLHGIAQQGFDVARQQNQADANKSQFGLFNQSIAQGGIQSGGYGIQRNQIQGQLARQQQNVGLQSQEETARYGEKMAQTEDTKKQLDLQAQKYGITGEQLQFELQKGLERLGLDTSTNVKDLMMKAQSSSLDDRILANNSINAAIQNGPNYEPGYPGYNAATGYAGPSAPGSQTVRRSGGF